MASPMISSQAVRAGGFMVDTVENIMQASIVVAAGKKLVAGHVLGVITATGKYTEYNPANADGSQTAAGILWDNCDATTADQRAAAIVRDAVVNANELTFFSGATSGQIQTALAALAAAGGPHIVSRPSAATGTPMVAPINESPPTVTGNAVVGQVLSSTTGVWQGAPTSYAYQWRRDGAAIGGATAATYTLVAGDSTHSITCVVTATNSLGSAASAPSNAIAVP
jgi:hypothetical protein